jgi:16S rRNA (guanine527-N7)-methyltransferase
MLGVEPAPETRERLLEYLDLIAHWNQAYNLTAVRDPQQMISRHLLDSLSVLPWLESSSLLDAGAGAGLPGVPLAIMRPALQVTLLDSAGKKIRFLRHVKRVLGLTNVHIVQQRLESAELNGAVSCIISRAFAGLAHYAAATRHLLQADTGLLAMKGRYPREEIAGLPAWIHVDRVEKLFVPGLHEQRHLVMMSLTA